MIADIAQSIKAFQHWMDGRSYRSCDWASLEKAIGNHENELALKLLEHKELVKDVQIKHGAKPRFFHVLGKQ